MTAALFVIVILASLLIFRRVLVFQIRRGHGDRGGGAVVHDVPPLGPVLMKCSICLHSLIALLLITAPTAAGDNVPASGSFGFNWLASASRCKKLSAKDLTSASACTVKTDAFGLLGRSLACKVNERVELMVYDTAARCQEALKTMQANAP